PRSGRGYEAHEFEQPLVWMLHAGGRRLEDLRELRAEREVLERLGLEADQGRLGEMEAPRSGSTPLRRADRLSERRTQSAGPGSILTRKCPRTAKRTV
ncbi:MAG TPA: hypothetical protein VFZ08_17015, partial [Terriglobia bacterium]|nr:hypothetical protein [Terriglobia bacterium]